MTDVLDWTTFTFNLDKAIQQWPICQKRTSRHKQFTFWTPDYIIKAPYKSDRVNLILSRAKFMQSLSLPFVVYPKYVLKIKDTSTYAIVFPNISTDKTIESKDYVETFTGIEHKLVCSQGVDKFQNLFLQTSQLDNYVPYLTFSFLVLYLLNTGDTGLYNVIVDKNTNVPYIIDYEEEATSKRTDSLFYFSKNPNKQVYNKWVEILEKYKQDVGTSFLSIAGKFPDRQVDITNIYNLFMNTDTIKSMEDNVTLPVYRGPFGPSKTYSGYSLDIIKSAIQKYIRRNMTTKALIAGYEMYEVGNLEGAKAVKTNLFNRLAVISAEDIGYANPELVLAVINYVLTRPSKDNPNKELAELFAIIQLLANSPKTRILSHLNRVYVVPEGRALAKKYNVDVSVPEDPEQAYKDKDLRSLGYYGKDLEHNWKIAKDYIPANVYTLMDKAVKKFSEKRPFAMFALAWPLMNMPNIIEPLDLTPTFNIWYNSEDTIKTIVNHEYQFTIDPFVVDKHTKEGRGQGADRNKFVTEGTVIIPEDTRFKHDLFEKIYIES